MSEASTLTPPQPETQRRSAQRRLTEREKREIVAAVAQGEPKCKVAERLNIHRNTVNAICRDVQGLPVQGKSTLSAWREKLDTGSFEAIEASVGDAKNDPHKAANTGLAWLKGVGVLQGDNQVNVTVQTMLASIPEEWRNEMIVTPVTPDTTTGSEVMPDNGATAVE